MAISSGVRGVTWCKTRKHWKIRIQVKGVIHYLGYSDSLPDAKEVVGVARRFYRQKKR